MSGAPSAPAGLSLASTIGPIDAGIVPDLRGEEAARFVAWLLGDEAKALISEFGVGEYGQSLFFPRAPGWSRTPTALTPQQEDS